MSYQPNNPFTSVLFTRPKPAAQPAPAQFKHEPGTVVRTEIFTLVKLQESFSRAGNGPLNLVDARGQMMCKIYPAGALINAPESGRYLNNVIAELRHYVSLLGEQGVIRIIKDIPNLEDITKKSHVTVAYFTGKGFDLSWP